MKKCDIIWCKQTATKEFDGRKLCDFHYNKKLEWKKN